MHAQLHSIDVENFRSIRGHVHAPLDAKVVLIHGENGAGKTSLLSAIQLALTGQVDSLRRADPLYQKQLLHKRATSGYVEAKIAMAQQFATYRTDLAPSAVKVGEALTAELAEFFAERAYLPQSLLGQLLQIYQESGSELDSPLARFVSSLLGLDRLDALEAGLKPVVDVRNLRRAVDRWSHVEKEKERLEALVKAQRDNKAPIVKMLTDRRLELVSLLQALDLQPKGSSPEDGVQEIEHKAVEDESRLASVTDHLRMLASIRRDMADGADRDADTEEALASRVRETGAALNDWRKAHGAQALDVRSRVEALLPDVTLGNDLNEFYAEAHRLLSVEQAQLTARVKRNQDEAAALTQAHDRFEVATAQLQSIDREVAAISSNAGALSAALAEIASFVEDDHCPVCGRDYSELDEGALQDHVHARTRALSSSAERLIVLGQTRNQQQSALDRLREQIEQLTARQIDAQLLAAQGRRASEVGDALQLLDAVREVSEAGQRLVEADVASRRTLAQFQQRQSRRLAIQGNLADIAGAMQFESLGEGEALLAFAMRIEGLLTTERQRLDERVRGRSRVRDIVADIDGMKSRLEEIDRVIAGYQVGVDRATQALERGKALRGQAQTIRSVVDTVRSTIIRREFNDRLNKLWRDLFVRLAPGETFVPAFRIPTSGATHRLQPALYTPHRDLGDEVAGGMPGAMLSAGNLNTAALTLFIALHLSVPVQLPWLILDDPVQSMDDIHIAHFAALLRTLSKEHDRQVMIAVHDRQLFEYLRLELSPAFADDSLITLELNRSSHRKTECIPLRYRFQEETALRVA